MLFTIFKVILLTALLIVIICATIMIVNITLEDLTGGSIRYWIDEWKTRRG